MSDEVDFITRQQLIQNLKNNKQLIIDPYDKTKCHFKYLSFFTKEKVIKKYANPRDIEDLTEEQDVLEIKNLFEPENQVTTYYLMSHYYYTLKPEYKDFDFSNWEQQKQNEEQECTSN